MFAVRHNFFYFTITLITWKEKIKLLLIASLVKGALFKESSWRFWSVHWSLGNIRVLAFDSYLRRDCGISQREKESYWGQIALPPTDWTRLWVCFPHTGMIIGDHRMITYHIGWYVNREIEIKWLEAILAGSWLKTATWMRTGAPVWKLPDMKELKGHPTHYMDEFLRNL